MREIKRRKSSIQSTKQITNAMKLVATAKLQKAKANAEETRPYFKRTMDTIGSIIHKSRGITHPYLTERTVKNKGYVVITSNRGLAGGYNMNLCKLIMRKESDKEQSKIIAVGKNGRDILKKNGYAIIKEYHDMVNHPSYRSAEILGKALLKMYEVEELDEIYIAYTSFKSTISHEPQLIRVLPVDVEQFEAVESEKHLMTFEPNEEEVLGHIIPRYINSLIIGALREAVASEHGARMTAMDSATKNASEIIDRLTLEYNRARQASITQEITEIVGGAEALK